MQSRTKYSEKGKSNESVGRPVEYFFVPNRNIRRWEIRHRDYSTDPVGHRSVFAIYRCRRDYWIAAWADHVDLGSRSCIPIQACGRSDSTAWLNVFEQCLSQTYDLQPVERPLLPNNIPSPKSLRSHHRSHPAPELWWLWRNVIPLVNRSEDCCL